jgi:hypothetical protein
MSRIESVVVGDELFLLVGLIGASSAEAYELVAETGDLIEDSSVDEVSIEVFAPGASPVLDRFVGRGVELQAEIRGKRARRVA